LPTLPHVDLVLTDPPYGDTSLAWDTAQDAWAQLISCDQFWCWGSFRYFRSVQFPGWKLAQEVVWEKHNGSGSAADRFRRVHEIAAHFYRGEWGALYRKPQYTNDATARAVRRKQRPPHWGFIEDSTYKSEDGGPRLMRSVFYARSCHGHAIHPTQKPIEVLKPLIEFSCPPGGTVLDPFMGSGSTGEACRQLGRKFIGIEADPLYFVKARNRLAETPCDLV
jgi:site-specific DNA-methyltransferase (adenine-specific)